MAGSSYEYVIAMVDKLSGPAQTAAQRIATMTDTLARQATAIDASKKALAALDTSTAAGAATRDAATAAIAKQELALTKQADAIRKAVAAEDSLAAKAARASSPPPGTAPPVAPGVPALKVPPIDTKPVDDLKRHTFDAAQAMTVGKETIGAAVAGMKSAITSLASGDVKGAFEGATEAVAGFAKSLDLVVPGLGEVASALVSVTGGAAGLTAGLVVSATKFAIASSEAKTAALAQWSALGEGKITGAQVNAMLEELRSQTGLAKDTLAPFTTEFLRMGVTGKAALEGLTKSAALAEATITGGGDAFAKLYRQVNAAAEGGQRLQIPYKKLASQLDAVGLNAGDIAKSMGIPIAKLETGLKAGTIDAKAFGLAMQDAIAKKGAGPMEALADSADNIGKLFKDYLGDLFADLGKSVQPFMGALKDAVSVLDSKTSPLGAALKTGIGGAMRWIFETLTKLVPVAREFFWGLVVLALKAYIAIAPIVLKFKAFLQSAEGMRAMHAVWTALVTVLTVVGVVIGAVVAFLASMAAIAVVVGVAVWNLIAAVGGFINSVVQGMVGIEAAIFGTLASIAGVVGNLLAPVADAFASVWDSVKEIFSPPNALAIATSLIDGLVGGITAGAARVADALKNVGKGAVDAVTNVLGIHSPSKVMAELGGHTSEGFARGVDSGADRAQNAVAAVVAPPTATPAASGGGGGGPITVNVGGLQLTIGAGVDEHAAQKIAELLPAAITKAFEELAMQLGGAIGGGS